MSVFFMILLLILCKRSFDLKYVQFYYTDKHRSFQDGQEMSSRADSKSLVNLVEMVKSTLDICGYPSGLDEPVCT